MALQINPSLRLKARRVQYPDGLPTGQAVITTAGRMVAAIKKSLSRCRGNTPIMMRRHY
jgi:O-acetyl-ADP-ribose deacetylase (regulator of RNase III)